MNESPAHDAHILDGLIAGVERSLGALQAGEGVPQAVRDHAAARREAADMLREAGASQASDAEGEGLLARAQRALERFAGDTADGPSPAAGSLEALERSEDALQARFDAALADRRLSGPVRDAVLRAYDRVKPGHDAVRQATLAANGQA